MVEDPETGAVAPERPRARAATTVLAAAMLGLAEVLEPTPPRDLGVEVVDAPTDEPDLALSFGRLRPIEPID